MAAPRKTGTRKAIPTPPPLWQRWLESQTVKWGLIVTAFGLLSFAFGTTRDLALGAWRHYTGAELAHEIAPVVSKLNDITVQQSALLEATAERVNVGEARLKKAEQILDAAQDSKRIEQEREGAVAKAQQSACLTGELSKDACHRLGYPTE